MTRGDSTGEGDGSEYGALMMLKKRNEYYSGNMPDSNYDFGNDYSSGGRDDEEDDDEDYEDDDCHDDRDEAIYVPAPRPKCRAERGKKDESMSLADNPEESCLGCGCLVLFIIGIFIVLQVYS